MSHAQLAYLPNMDLATLFTQSFIVGFSGAMMPGPVFAVNVSESPRHGWKTGPLITIGHGVAELILVCILAMGIATLADNQAVLRGIALLGGGGLILMGLMMLADIYRGSIKYEPSATSAGQGKFLIVKGMTTTLSNPYWFVWWATAGLSFVAQARPHGAIGQATFFAGHILADLVWYTAIACIVWTGRRLLVGNGLKILLTVCALFLLYVGGSFIYRGVTGIYATL